MIRRILVPLDGSALAEAILPCVHEFVFLTGASLTLFQVVEPRGPRVELAAPAAAVNDDGWETADALHAAQDYLAAVARQLARDGVVVRTQVVVGAAAEEIIRATADVDLVAMATHGRSGVSRWVYGSVAARVLRAAPVPVLLVRVSQDQLIPTGYPRRILVPLDGSSLAERALPPAISLARGAHAELILTTSVTPVQEIPLLESLERGDAPGAGSLEEQMREHAACYLHEVAARSELAGLTVHPDARLSRAADGIIESALEWRADLVVMSTHGRSGIGRWVYGSVAEKVLAEALMPVLLVRAGVPVAGPVSLKAVRRPPEAVR